MSNRGLAICVGAIVLAAIVIFQRLLMNIGAEDMKLIPGLADFSPAWNRGVSFSLFARNTDIGRYLSMAVLSVIVIGVLILAWHAQSRLTAAALGLILGGALGNLLDRGLCGGVFDFLSLHLGSMPLFVCNLADMAISAGALLLVADVLSIKGARDFGD